MATITTLKTTPHTRIENSIIVNMADIGVYCYAVYSAIKMHLNQTTGACFPSYATIARMTGIHRSTVIDCVKKLTALKLVSPLWRYKEDGSHASNQYDFQAPETPVPAEKAETIVQKEQYGRPEPPPPVAQDDHPSRPERPEQVFSLNKKEERTTESLLLPTEKQQTCQHPAPAIVYLSDNITLCHHCYGLLDENLTLITEEKFLADRGADERRALPERDPAEEGNPEGKHPPEAGAESVAA
jgi:Helix-turn-helix domain